jgi:hypothetical protein
MWSSSDDVWEPQEQGPSAITVIEDDVPTFGGVYDHDGNELHRERQRPGFFLGEK